MIRDLPVRPLLWRRLAAGALFARPGRLAAAGLPGFLGTVVLAALTQACGAPAVVGPQPAVGRAGGAYDVACQAQNAEYTKELADGKYAPVELVLHLWPGKSESKSGSRSFRPEKEFVADLVANGTPTGSPTPVRTILVLARGGTGKSKLAWSIAAQTCQTTPVFRVDLNTDIAAHLDTTPAGDNPIASYIARELQLDVKAGAMAALQVALGGKPWLVILDSLDEVPLLQRPAVTGHIDALVTQAVGARALVMTRPPVFTSNYGIKTIDAKVEIPQLTCDETDAAVARSFEKPDERKAFDEFIKRYGLDRKVNAFDRCYYPHMATYRDLQVVQRLARNTAADKSNPDLKDFQNSRAQVYTYFVTAQLIKDMQGLLLPADAIGLVDAMVAAHNPDAGMRNLPFTVQHCAGVPTFSQLQGKDGADDAAQKQAVCERLLQSALFKAGSEAGVWHFANQTLGDLFLARWAAARMTKDGNVDCSAIAQRADLLESNEVAGFLVGLEAGQRCLAPVLVELCRRAGYSQNVFEQLDQGLPSGSGRAAALDLAQKQLASLPNDMCVTGLVEGLGKAMEGAPPPPVETAPVPAVAPAPTAAPKGKAGKGKPSKKAP